MKLAVFQPPYPDSGTMAAARECVNWMQTRLAQLPPKAHDLILLPEYATAPGLDDPALLRQFAETEGAAFLQTVAAAAQRLHCTVVLAGPCRSGARWFNRTWVYAGERAPVFSYDKVHLTAAEAGDLGLTPGTGATVYQHGPVRIGVATCLDLSFAEHFEVLGAQQADLILCHCYQRSVPGERLLLQARARALDSGAHVVRSTYAMARPETGGHSLAAAPDGTLLAEAGTAAGILEVAFDPLTKLRQPASHGQPPVEHRTLLESRRRPGSYRTARDHGPLINAAP